jgi:hypothetical protein
MASGPCKYSNFCYKVKVSYDDSGKEPAFSHALAHKKTYTLIHQYRHTQIQTYMHTNTLIYVHR